MEHGEGPTLNNYEFMKVLLYPPLSKLVLLWAILSMQVAT